MIYNDPNWLERVFRMALVVLVVLLFASLTVGAVIGMIVGGHWK